MKTFLSISLFLVLAFGSIAFGQQSGSVPSSLSESPQVDNSQQTDQSLAEQARRVRKDHSEEVKLTPADEKELFAAVDRISAFASEDSGLALHGPVKRRVIGPDEVEKSTRERLSGKDYDDRFARSELTMKKFGLLPRTFDLKEFIIKTRRKEIGGYYDNETKTISLLNTIPLEQQALASLDLPMLSFFPDHRPLRSKGSDIQAPGDDRQLQSSEACASSSMKPRWCVRRTRRAVADPGPRGRP